MRKDPMSSLKKWEVVIMSCIVKICTAPASDPSLFLIMIIFGIFGAIGGYVTYGILGAIAGFFIGFFALPALLIILGLAIVLLVVYILIMIIVYLGKYIISLI
jgi:hypothetical protein